MKFVPNGASTKRSDSQYQWTLKSRLPYVEARLDARSACFETDLSVPLKPKKRTYLIWFQKTLTFVSKHASVKPVLMALQTLGTTGTGSQTHLILARLDTKVSVF